MKVATVLSLAIVLFRSRRVFSFAMSFWLFFAFDHGWYPTLFTIQSGSFMASGTQRSRLCLCLSACFTALTVWFCLKYFSYFYHGDVWDCSAVSNLFLKIQLLSFKVSSVWKDITFTDIRLASASASTSRSPSWSRLRPLPPPLRFYLSCPLEPKQSPSPIWLLPIPEITWFPLSWLCPFLHTAYRCLRWYWCMLFPERREKMSIHPRLHADKPKMQLYQCSIWSMNQQASWCYLL